MDAISRQLFERAQKAIPGGVNSPVRAFRAVASTVDSPVFFSRGKGAYLTGADGKVYTDYVGSWGPMILGHAHPEVLEAIIRAALDGTSFGAPTLREVQLAERLQQLVPSMELVRCVSSGTEATMSALRLARGATGRTKVIKFDGCYHGHADYLLVKAGSGGATFGVPDSAGVPPAVAQDTITVAYNDLAACERIFAEEGQAIAAVILEPVAANMGVILPAPGFLEGLRRLTQKHGAILIFDEVITGFRVALGGAQARYGITPDLSCFGKIVGGGLPLACYGGRRDLMSQVAPLGPVYQAGTLSGNPLAVAAGLATLEVLSRRPPSGQPDAYQQLEKLGARLFDGLNAAAASAGVAARGYRVGSVMSWFFVDPAFLKSGREIRSWDDAKDADRQRFARYFAGMLDRGVYLAPSQFEAAFVSLAHTEQDIDQTVEAARLTFAQFG
jgi:glutamate-1-semialdehyde 2,1-aminomutase